MPDELISRDEVLGGLPAKRASTLLFFIESRTAHMVARSRQAMEPFLTEEGARERDLAFLEAFALGREPPLRPTIQDLERHAPQWAHLVPENPQLRAAVAHLLGQKFQFTYQAVPGIRAALGLDEDAVQRAYQRLYRQPLETIFASQITLLDRLRRVWAVVATWLELLPPFWTAFALTLTETVGAGILALPIALAEVGPLAGVVFLVLLGFINVLTIASIAEAVARSGSIRYGNAFFGRLVAEYLGNVGSLILSLSLTLLCFVMLLAYYIGLSTTLADATPVPAEVWAALLFLIGLYFLRAESLNATVAWSLLVGMINIGLILILSLLAFAHLRSENLLYVNVPLLGGRPFEPSILRLIFGVILMAYFGHLSIGNCAKVVLRRDPSARSLIWGSVAAQVTAIVLYSTWVLAVNGAIAPQVLAGHSGTALAPLAEQVGPSVHAFGAVFVVLGMGMASIHYSLGLYNTVRERLPARPQKIVLLPRQQGRLLFYPRGKPGGNPYLALIYLGLEGGRPHFRLEIPHGGRTHHVDTTVAHRWEARGLLDRLPNADPRKLSLVLEVLDASEEHVRVRVTSPMSLAYEGGWDATGLRVVDVLTLPDALRQLVTWITRRGEVSLADVAAHSGQSTDAARTSLDTLEAQGFVQRIEGKPEPRYRTLLAPKRGRQLPRDIWKALVQTVGTEAHAGRVPRWAAARAVALKLREAVLTERGRFFLSVSPVGMVFLLIEWLFLTGAESFAEPLSFGGVITASLVGGVFPVLLLTASGQKGEFVPAALLPFLGHWWLKAGIYLLFLVGIVLHGLFIWHRPAERACALIASALALGATVAMVRRGAFAGRVVVQLREDRLAGGRAVFAITANGQAAPAEVRLGYPDGEQHYQAATGEIPAFSSLRDATFHVPATPAKELKVWAHRVTPSGDSEALPTFALVYDGDEVKRFDLHLLGGQVVLPFTGEATQVKIRLAKPASA